LRIVNALTLFILSSKNGVSPCQSPERHLILCYEKFEGCAPSKLTKQKPAILVEN